MENNNKVGVVAAKIISGVLHPLLIPTYNVSLLFVYTNFGLFFRKQEFRILLPVLIFTFVIPMAFLAILKEFKIVKDYDLSDRNDRLFPFFISLLANCSLFYFFYSAKLQLWFLALLLSSIILIFITMIISMFWKISAHLTAMGGLIGGVFAISFYIYKTNPFLLFCALFIFAGCSAVARLYLQKNTPAQIYVGFILGLSVSYLTILLGPIIIVYFMNLFS